MSTTRKPTPAQRQALTGIADSVNGRVEAIHLHPRTRAAMLSSAWIYLTTDDRGTEWAVISGGGMGAIGRYQIDVLGESRARDVEARTIEAQRKEQDRLIRAWANANGHMVSARGRVPVAARRAWLALDDTARKRWADAYAVASLAAERHGLGAKPAPRKAASAATAPKPGHTKPVTAAQRREALTVIADALEDSLKMMNEARALILALLNS